MQQDFNYDVIAGVTSNHFPKNILVNPDGSLVSAGLAYLSTATIQRAANVTAYTANDVYGAGFELQNIASNGGFIFLASLDIILNITAVPTGMTSFTVYLYPTAPTVIADNGAYALGNDPILDPRGFILSMSLMQGGGKVVGSLNNINQLFKLTGTSLFGYIVTNSAFTPAANSETGTIRARSFAP